MGRRSKCQQTVRSPNPYLTIPVSHVRSGCVSPTTVALTTCVVIMEEPGCKQLRHGGRCQAADFYSQLWLGWGRTQGDLGVVVGTETCALESHD